ncbi:MAG: hypothetical protein DMG22_10455 [Acidobacteria bacterium]|nr:MAG: hypothetical protein DMG22_10455 [Acidobacteriota bacterium]
MAGKFLEIHKKSNTPSVLASTAQAISSDEAIFYLKRRLLITREKMPGTFHQVTNWKITSLADLFLLGASLAIVVLHGQFRKGMVNSGIHHSAS